MANKQKLSDPAGFTLIEVLVTLIVVAIGLLGLANLQIVGLRNNHNNSLTSQALWLTKDIIDKARSNAITTYSDSDPYECPDSPPPSPTSCANAEESNCTPAEMAAYDRWEWEKMVCDKLPNATITLCTDSDPADSNDCVYAVANKGITPYMVKLEWNDTTKQNERQQLIVFFQVTRKPDDIIAYLNSYKRNSN